MPQETQTTYRGYTLDAFQREAIEWLSAGDSVLVSAPTGTGKTLIADFLVDMAYQAGEQVIYTAPIKALSNQKFKEFKALLGEEHVGILTGDVVRNPEGAVLIMTTEIFRNLIHTDPGRLRFARYVIFDEIHYIDDPVRGSVWEESLIFLPPHMRFLGLSATIPNVDELARWIERIHGRKVRVITHFERAVPLEHRLFEQSLGECTRKAVENRYRRYAARFGKSDSGIIAAKFEPTRHVDLVRHIQPDLLPCLYFTFSRRKCELNAHELAESEDYLAPAEKRSVRRVIAETVEKYQGAGAQSIKRIERLLLRGIAYHHAGLLPVVKDVVEELFERRLIHVLYCTETFAVGLNFPCRTVCFDATTKWDGTRFRALSNREYFQMAGRAGRRGIDERGYVYTAIDFNFFRPEDLPSMREEDVEPLKSRFSLSYNSVLNLINNYDMPTIESILSRNFASFQAEEDRERLAGEMERLDRELEDVLGGTPAGLAGLLEEYVSVSREIDRLAARIKKKERERDYRGLGRDRKEVRRRTRRLRELEAQGVEPGALREFLPRLKSYRRISARRRKLAEELSRLPTPGSFIEEFLQKKALLEALDYVRDGALTSRGIFASQINGSELLVTELYFRGVFNDWDEDAVNALAASVDYEPRKGEERKKHDAFDQGAVRRTVHLIQEMEKAYLGFTGTEFNDHLAPAARAWSAGAPFERVGEIGGVDDGDLVYGFRRAIDVLRQVRQAARQDEFLTAKLTRCIEKMDRDEVSILL